MTRQPYSDPEYLRTVQYVPFDADTDAAARYQDQSQAAYMFARAVEREQCIRGIRAIVASLTLCLCGWVVAVIWCLL